MQSYISLPPLFKEYQRPLQQMYVHVYQGIAMLGYLRSTMTNLKNLQINFFYDLEIRNSKKGERCDVFPRRSIAV